MNEKQQLLTLFRALNIGVSEDAPVFGGENLVLTEGQANVKAYGGFYCLFRFQNGIFQSVEIGE